jgi:prephenate dehydrogenase
MEMIMKSEAKSKERQTIETASEVYNAMQESAGQKLSFYKRMQMSNEQS